MPELERYGWDPFFAQAFEPYAREGFDCGRVSAQHRDAYWVYTHCGELYAKVRGNVRYRAAERGDLPAAGDWVVLSIRPDEAAATIHDLLPRKTKFSRKVAGEHTDEQVVAANIDIVFLVSGLDADFNPRRIERYLTMAWESGAEPVILLNKADLCSNVEGRVDEAAAAAPGVPVVVASALTAQGLDELRAQLPLGRTAAFLGSSGVGKSSLINRLLGADVQAVREVRSADDRGRHTTAYRRLFVLDSGGLVLDVPGMRELQLWSAGEGFSATFEDIEELAAACRYRDCRHESETGCAVQSAIKNGTLERARLESYHKLQRELRHLEIEQDRHASWAEKQRIKQIHRQLNRRLREKQHLPLSFRTK